MTNTFDRFPTRLAKEAFYPVAYRYMYLSRTLDNTFKELFRKRLVKGTVILCHGGEATAVGMALAFRPGRDIFSILHRDLAAHLIAGADIYTLACQYMANADSPTLGREGNVHHGDARNRRLPMISHLGNMLAPAVGATWAARHNGEDVFGLSVIGDGGSSTGDFHESINFAAVRKSPVLFVIENNNYAYSTPTALQFRAEKLSDRAIGYGIKGQTVDGTDVWEVYNAAFDALEEMSRTSLPYILECRCLRLEGHAVYDTAEYVSEEERAAWMKREPMAKARAQLAEAAGYSEGQIRRLETGVEQEIEQAIGEALKCSPPDASAPIEIFAPLKTESVPAFESAGAKNGSAVTLALDYILRNNPNAVLLGQDIGRYGSAFKTCKGLFETHGPDRVIDTPICESAMTGFSLGASQCGVLPILEFQFADFGTEAVTQLGLNAASWFFRSHVPAQILLRMPCGGGITLGAFHSGEYDGLWSRFPGLKLLYPTTPQEMFEALVAGFYDPNPCIVFEHKGLYWTEKGDIAFDGDLANVYRPRQYAQGDELTIIAMGAMVRLALSAVRKKGVKADIWNPFLLNPQSLSPLIESVQKTGRLLVVQEGGMTASLGNHYIAEMTKACFSQLRRAPGLVSAPDKPVPFARELEVRHLPDERTISNAIEKIMGGKA